MTKMTLKLNQFNFSVIDAAATRVAARCVNSDVKTMCSITAATRVAVRALRRGNARCVVGVARVSRSGRLLDMLAEVEHVKHIIQLGTD